MVRERNINFSTTLLDTTWHGWQIEMRHILPLSCLCLIKRCRVTCSTWRTMSTIETVADARNLSSTKALAGTKSRQIQVQLYAGRMANGNENASISSSQMLWTWTQQFMKLMGAKYTKDEQILFFPYLRSVEKIVSIWLRVSRSISLHPSCSFHIRVLFSFSVYAQHLHFRKKNSFFAVAPLQPICLVSLTQKCCSALLVYSR